MLKIYFAARYSRRAELCAYRDQLQALEGVKVTSRWLNGNHTAESDDLAAMRRFGCEDLQDLREADVYITFSEPPRTPSTNRGGRHVEFGYALASGMQMILIGPVENVFHALGDVRQFDTFAEFMRLGISVINLQERILHQLLQPLKT